ncbi:MAG TPA: rRNA pseudouridine synthase [Candidatus Ornithospirochaeta avicola]|uniref:Pseudouridine synthase n=1 Tax=Candidatus Ornithospirochaeta avicola TaxID=2840896 RepID=A0A9D1PS98_9SPIO|nr:rRNA pseudouridine synthase [Candidatus Ornithospirochaeta avicola]
MKETNDLYPLRLQAYLAKCGVASRRASEELIKQGRVMVNNRTVTEMGVKVGEDDIVQVDGETVELTEQLYYIALNKPRGYVCTNYDPNEELYAKSLITIRDNNLLYNVGRLDKESCGLLLFTNDGKFANALMHPKYEIEKEYLVKIDRPVEIEDLNKALDGLYIDMSKPYRIKRYDFVPRTKQYIKITLTEGKNREIRKIFAFLGYDVKSLVRIRIGCVELKNLETGEWRNLKKSEIEGLLQGKNTLSDRKRTQKRRIKDGNRN